ncbi:hypothetical protein SAMN04488100_11426 [Alkalibacterium putridalgicola]|uniref:Uncharacterized protein n=1 Tax=Alkalibacterium putridalgicola TaxID=426703 RepID=A0A1H7TU56_9LACT|nr:hypothetical protein [Alkalibacterium putridalgicola]GEK88607.1 hypothetical protein APU01nite_06460 [Alkalibacterium putridalgicola]SEL88410.1 hypothetical protein SAMN04488100_11426 [Alkalibacterium putridalgicola]
MERSNNKELQLIAKVVTLIMLSYIVPVFGIVFSTYILTSSDIIRYATWVKALSSISLILQLMVILGMVIGWLTWLFS